VRATASEEPAYVGACPLNTELLIERLFQALISGDRLGTRGILCEPFEEGATAEEVVTQVLWPCYDLIDRLHRADHITRLAHHLGTRLLRSLVDQLALRYEQKPDRSRTIFAFSGPTDSDELGAQMAVDLLEADGYTVTFGGGGIANDEILAQLGEMQPDVMLIFASAPTDLPEIRHLVDMVHEIGTCGDVQVVVGGGVFNRADGLAEEIGADLWANNPQQLLERMADEPDRRATADQRTVGLRRKRREAA
jgi:methanogenic corrinoid protein MtbC1